MTFSADDPRWTAYVLDELDASERAELDEIVAKDPDARAFVASLRDTTELLALELGAGADRDTPALALSAAQRRDIVAAAAGERDASEALSDMRADNVVAIKRPGARRVLLLGGLAAAAAAALLVVFASPKSKTSAVHGDAVQRPPERSLEAPIMSELSDPAALSTETTAQRETGRYWNRNEALANTPTGGGGDDGAVMPATDTGVAYLAHGRDRWQNADPAAPVDIPVNGVLDLRLSDNKATQTVDMDGNVRAPFHNEAYDQVVDNPFVAVADDPRSTFSIDVDTAAYANIRRYLMNGSRPPRGAVRIEEMINYFAYDYPGPTDDRPFAMHVEMTQAPWQPGHKLMKIGIKGKELTARRPRANLVFLIDVSGSMEDDNKLPLLRRAMSMLTRTLDSDDRVAIVVYAGASGVVLPSTSVSQGARIESALERLRAGGSTNGGEGIRLAYDIAAEHFVKDGVNRVILATDGDFNVGLTDRDSLLRLIEEKARSGVFLTVLGFGMGNYKDGTLEQLADHGNGNYAYIDTISEAKKVLVDQLNSTLVTIAKDVKIQIEFNPLEVARFRLIGYENRVLAHQDFNDDTKDAGDIGAGHTVTALYEIEPVARGAGAPGVDALRYQRELAPADAAYSGELLTLKLRYKRPEGQTSALAEWPIRDQTLALSDASRDLSFAAAVAAFGMILRDSEYKGTATLGMVEDLATRGAKNDRHGYRAEFLDLVARARKLGVR